MRWLVSYGGQKGCRDSLAIILSVLYIHTVLIFRSRGKDTLYIRLIVHVLTGWGFSIFFWFTRHALCSRLTLCGGLKQQQTVKLYGASIHGAVYDAS